MWTIGRDSKVTPEAIKEFNAQSPRTTAIVGAAILEDAIGRVIGSKLPIEGETKKQLFKPPGGPLSSLDAKIKVAYAMGVFSKMAFQDLVKICEVRNKFAHRLDIADFEHSEVRPACMSLKLIERHIFPSGTEREDVPDAPRMMIFMPGLDKYLPNPRGRYFLSIMLIHGIDMYVPHPDNPKPRPPRELI